MIGGDGADGTRHVDNFRGLQLGGERRDHAAARHRKLNITEIQKGVTTEIHAISLDGGDRTRGVNGGVALHENHARHIAGHEMRVLRAWCGCAALRGDQAVALKLTGELLKRRALKSRENERCLDGLKSGA